VPTIGVRKLKNEATQIIRSVRDEGEEYVITVNGEPVAVLRPVTDADREEQRRKRAREWLDEVERLAREISASRVTNETAVELVRQQRR